MDWILELMQDSIMIIIIPLVIGIVSGVIVLLIPRGDKIPPKKYLLSLVAILVVGSIVLLGISNRPEDEPFVADGNGYDSTLSASEPTFNHIPTLPFVHTSESVSPSTSAQSFLNSVTFNYSNNNGRFTIGTGEYEFTTDWSKASNTSIHAYSDAANIQAIALWRDSHDISELPDINDFDFSSRARTPQVGDSIIWINTNGHVAITRIEAIKDDTRGDLVDELTFTYKIFPIQVQTPITNDLFQSADLHGIVSFNYSNNDGRFTIGTGEYKFTTEWSKASNTSIHAYNDAANIQSIALWRNSHDISVLPDINEFDFSSRARTPRIGDSIIWININGHVAITRIEALKDDTRGDAIDELTFSYRIFRRQ